MTKPEALTKLLRYCGPMELHELRACCGWAAAEFDWAFAALRKQGSIHWRNVSGFRRVWMA